MPVVSFIIPARNEGGQIGATLTAIHRYPPKTSYEVIVVDHESTDDTREIAKAGQSKVIINQGNTIASSRNQGAKASKGEILIFLDADVRITLEWQMEIGNTISELQRQPMIITGSRCAVSNHENWIAKYWFDRMRFVTGNYINSGHLITSYRLFETINGFNAKLETAEDFDFAERARKIGARIVNNPKLVVVHERYPDNIRSFIKRERWHGREDFKNLKNILRSANAILVLVNIGIAFMSLILSILEWEPFYLVTYPLSLFLLLTVVVGVKFGIHFSKSTVISPVIGCLYLIGRTCAFVDIVKSRVELSFSDRSS